jgi:hypothetical protein
MAAEGLCARQQIHQVSVVLAALLYRPPRQIVERLEVTPGFGGFRLRATVGGVRAGWSRRGLEEKNESEKKCHREQ